MEEVVVVDMVKACENLKQDALDAAAVKVSVVSCFHELV